MKNALRFAAAILISSASTAFAAVSLPLGQIRLPPGFSIAIYAEAPGARSMAQGPDGVLFVGTRDEGKVYAILPNADRTRAEKVVTIASRLNMPNGVAYRDGALYVAEINRILRYDKIMGSLQHPPKPVVVKGDFPTDRAHGWKFIRFGPDGDLYVPVGAPCNDCERDPPYETITRMKPDGSDFEIYARGVRNSVGFDWDPATHELWFTDNGRDWLGDDKPADKLNYAPKPGMNFGYPYCQGGDIPDPDFGSKHACSEFTPPARQLGPHVAALGMRFYEGDMFPSQYKGSIFIAEHGSWNRTHKIGYRVTQIKLENGKPMDYLPFAQGWLQGETNWGRPVDVEVLKDGSMLVSDDYAGVIYRISYKKPS